MDTSDFAKRLADKLIEQLKVGIAPWQQPWAAGHMLSPYNPTTGNRYRGINILALMVTGRSDPRWMTYRQAQAQGWQVRAGEKGTQIQHWIWEEARARLGKDGKPELDKAGNPIKELVRLSRPKVIAACVFNAEQIEAIPELEPSRQLEWDPVEKAEKLLGASRAKIEHSQGGGAFYRVGTDTIHLPSRERFSEAADYYATALHELGHWTGHPDRLDRDLSNPFGSEGYAREELRAEIASMIIGSELGIGHDPVAHAGYVDHWVQILTDTPKEILYAAADAERISEYILTIEHKREISQTQEVTAVKEQIPHGERTYLAVPYEERDQAKAMGARWDPFKKAWYVGPSVEPEKIAKWEIRHQEAATFDPRAEFAEVLRSIGGIVEGEHPIMDGKEHRLATEKDKRGEAAIFYRAYLDGVPNGYAENNRTKEVRRWKARGQGLSEEQKSELLAEAEKKRYERRREERKRVEATADRLSVELRSFPSGVEKTAYHDAKGIEPMAGAPVRNGDALVPGYDVNGKVWTVQYIKGDGTKRFARESRKHGCFHVVGAASPAKGLQKLANSPVIAIAEGYATAATVAKYGKVPTVAAFDSGNLLAVATALHEHWPDKRIMIAGDDDHKLENNPGRVKAMEAALAVPHGMVVFPNFTAEQREKGMTDFNDLALENARLAKRQLEEAVWCACQQGQEQTGEKGKGVLRLDSWAGRREISCEILKETPHRFVVRLGEDCLLPGGRQATKGQEVYVPKDAVERVGEQTMDATIGDQ
jgi:putative DNA primase/helicase